MVPFHQVELLVMAMLQRVERRRDMHDVVERQPLPDRQRRQLEFDIYCRYSMRRPPNPISQQQRLGL